MQSSEENIRKAESHAKSLKEMEEEQKRRRQADIERYKKVYNVDYTDESHYDFILDTTHISPQEATKKVADFIENRL
jgi:cytidylate kinase